MTSATAATAAPMTSVGGEPAPPRELRALLAWVGDGRALTQTGRIKLADARELAVLLGTGEERALIEQRITSSAELPALSLVVEWGKACRLVRVNRGRLVPVKKHAGLLQRPAELWERMFEAFPLLGEALCVDGWAESLMRRHFREAIDAVLLRAYRAGGPIAVAAAGDLAWDVVTAPYILGGTEQQHDIWRRMNDRDLRYALEELERLGALRCEGDAVALTERGRAAMRRVTGDAQPGDAIAQLKVTLLGVAKPAVWRRVLVPADARLDRLHDVIQAAFGWQDCHLHAFTAGGVDYGPPDPELDHRDERATRLGQLLRAPGDRIAYCYDFGDGWEHAIVLEQVLAAEAGACYPACVAGCSRCPPEDCGGTWGYAELREALADPSHDRHDELLDWLGIDSAADFDPAAFDVDEANELLAAVAAGR